MILGPPNVLPTAELAVGVIKLDICQAAVLSPAVLQEMSKNPEQLKELRKLNFLSWCGAPLSSAAVAENVRAHVNLIIAYGATESGILPITVDEVEDSEWMYFNSMIGATFRPLSGNLYELVIVKDPKIQAAQFVFCNFPELSEWHTKDMFAKHPTKDLWRYQGRRDDIIIMSNGLNINPLMLEGAVMNHPLVISALLTGNDRLQAAWLIESRNPPHSDHEREQLVQDIWPTI